ncbi:MAG: hypothetical protein QOK47_994 [Actinomycetota bacterium]|nr:hypothetical protein [Actinomycetota bacterium]
MALPFPPPIAPMLAKLQKEIPQGDEWIYEPKWDGFRAIVFRDGSEVTLISRDQRPFERYFPELIPAFLESLPRTCIVDGEIVIPGETALDFGSMLMRIHPAASRVKLLSEQTPASFVAFDLLAHGKTDLRETHLVKRRARLEKALDQAIPHGASREQVMDSLRPAPRVVLTPQTEDPVEAKRWFEVYEGAGLDGVIAKRKDLLYLPGDRAMTKVKHQRTADCVVGGYRLSKTGDGIGSLLLGLYTDSGALTYVGHTSAFKAAERKALLKEFRSLEGGVSFEGARVPGGPSRWTGSRDMSWVPLSPELVCEVTFDHLQGNRFRHAAGFVRWRPEKPPSECTFDQVL